MNYPKHSSMKLPTVGEKERRPPFNRSVTLPGTVEGPPTTVPTVIAEPEEFSDESGDKTSPSRRHKNSRRHGGTCQQKTTTCVKRFCLYLVSYAGLITVVVLYSVLGGFLFQYLEARHEDKVHVEALELRHEFARNIEQKLNHSCIQQLRRQLPCANSSALSLQCNISSHLLDLAGDFMVETYKLVSDKGWMGEHDADHHMSDEGRKWTFAGSLLFSVTVITTIGYGSVTPKTDPGRIVTMVYALIGIPLTILCITKIGKAMASLFRALYGGTFCVECRQQFFQSVSNRRRGNAIDHDSSPENERGEASKGHEHKQTEVPIIICLLLMIWYIIIGAILFKIWEKDWKYLDGAYFCFITLSTIGFGDIVPGFSYKDWDDQVKQVVCSLYLLIGLSTLAMCFDLMQQSAIRLANKLGRCVGLKPAAA